jgi:hypothetical protein
MNAVCLYVVYKEIHTANVPKSNNLVRDVNKLMFFSDIFHKRTDLFTFLSKEMSTESIDAKII